MYSAQNDSHKILVTEVGSLLGFSVAKLFLSQNKQVYGAGKIPPPEEIIKNSNFTLLDISLAQPFPEHLPKFDDIYHLLTETEDTLKNFLPSSSVTPATNHIVSQTKQRTKVTLFAPIITSTHFYENLTRDEVTKQNLKLYLCGDIYGPYEPFINVAKNHPHTFRHHTRHFYYHNELTNMIAQALLTDKVILEDEGARTIYPTFIGDAIGAIEQFQKEQTAKNIKIIVSEGAKISLACAYDIQKIAKTSLNKELKLYFSGQKKEYKQEPHPVIHTHLLGFTPKVKLEDGLKQTLQISEGKKQEEVKASFQRIIAPTQSRIGDIQNRLTEHLEKPKESKLKKFASYVPIKKSHLKSKSFFLAIVILLLLFFGKTGFDLYSGSRSLKAAVDSLSNGDFNLAKDKSESASKSYKSAKGKVKLLTGPASIVTGKKAASIDDSLNGLYLASTALNSFTQGAQKLSSKVVYITSKNTKDAPEDQENIQSYFHQAFIESSESLYLIKSAKENNLFSNKLNEAEIQVKNLNNYSSQAIEISSFIEDLVNPTGKNSYLVLVQDNLELRPGGGLVKAFGEIQFENGKLTDIKFEDVNIVDEKLHANIAAPQQLADKLDIEQLFLKDVSWSLDFAANAATARDIYKKTNDKDVEGVIALDLIAIAKLLEITGPINLIEINQSATAENILELVDKNKENSFLPAVVQTLFNKIAEISSGTQPQNNTSRVNLFKAFTNSLTSKQLLLSFKNKNLASIVKVKAWNNVLPPASFDPSDDTAQTRDFLALSEANLGTNRVNRLIKRKVDYDVTVGTEATLIAKLKVTFENASNSENYVNFLRVYTPSSSSLLSYKNGEGTDTDDVEVNSASGLTVFALDVEVPPKETKTVQLSYRIPKKIKLEQTPTYAFYVSKQPGTENYPFTFSFNLPQNIQIESISGDEKQKGSQTLKYEIDLLKDQKFEIEVVKK